MKCDKICSSIYFYFKLLLELLLQWGFLMMGNNFTLNVKSHTNKWMK